MRFLPLITLLAAATGAHAQTITNLNTLSALSSVGLAISHDGSAVVGSYSLTPGADKSFRWTQAGGMADLGNLGGNPFSKATAISANGGVVVGYGYAASASVFHAYRWTQAGGMVDLTPLVGQDHVATAVSGDGNVVVINDISGADRAYRWTQAGGRIDIGDLGGGTAAGHAISGDGTIIVGKSSLGGNELAFRWTQGSGMTSLGHLGGGASEANAISQDGLVVVGSSFTNTFDTIAFRWTQAAGMVSLGHLGGAFSVARAVSGNGGVIVGESLSGAGTRAFRWTQADGMSDLGTLGGSSSRAFGVSGDGTIIVGESETGTGATHAFLHRNSVMLDAVDWLGSVAGVQSVLSTTLSLTSLHVEGAHHRPLAELGRGRSYWATGDIAGSSRSRDMLTRSGEAGVTFEPWANVLVGVGGGYGLQDHQLVHGGASRTSGQYLLGEIDFMLAGGGILSGLFSSGDWANRTNRSYLTGAGADFSQGSTDLRSNTFRVRYDSPVLARAYGNDLKGFVSYGHNRVRSDAYLESGGSNPASFSGMDQTAKEGRLGLVLTRQLGADTSLRLAAEWIRRFDHDQADLTATDVTSLLNLSLPTPDPVRDQARVGLDIDHKLDARTTLTLSVHAAGAGAAADVSGALSLRRAF
jgi:probable HAF family extracellular repeat protein